MHAGRTGDDSAPAAASRHRRQLRVVSTPSASDFVRAVADPAVAVIAAAPPAADPGRRHHRRDRSLVGHVRRRLVRLDRCPGRRWRRSAVAAAERRRRGRRGFGGRGRRRNRGQTAAVRVRLGSRLFGVVPVDDGGRRGGPVVGHRRRVRRVGAARDRQSSGRATPAFDVVDASRERTRRRRSTGVGTATQRQLRRRIGFARREAGGEETERRRARADLSISSSGGSNCGCGGWTDEAIVDVVLYSVTRREGVFFRRFPR